MVEYSKNTVLRAKIGIENIQDTHNENAYVYVQNTLWNHRFVCLKANLIMMIEQYPKAIALQEQSRSFPVTAKMVEEQY